jgi:hypothetical protein
MARLFRSAGAVVLAVVLALGTSVGPARGGQTPSDEVPTTTPPAESAEPTAPVTSTEAPPGVSVEESVDLRITVVFDKAAYVAHETITARATVVNVGTATAEGVVVGSTGTLSNDNWAPLRPPGVRLAAGESAVGVVDGLATRPEDGEVRLTVEVRSDSPDADPADNSTTVVVPVSITYGDYVGVVHVDHDSDAVVDPGEALGDVPVTIEGGAPATRRETRTAADGRFAFRDLPTGWYHVEVHAGEQWWFGRVGPVLVDEVTDPETALRGARRVPAGSLSVSASLDKASYAVGEKAKLSLVVANSGPVALNGVTADGSATGLPFGFLDFGVLAPGGPGATLPPHSSRTFEVVFPVLDEAFAVGYVDVAVRVGAPPDFNGLVHAGARAKVPGGVARMALGLLLHDPRSEPASQVLLPVDRVPGVKVYLRDRATGAVVARAVSDPDGYFRFHDVPADEYEFGVVGPWKAGVLFAVRHGENGDPVHVIRLSRGPVQPDPDAVPAPGAPVAGGLADTGVEVAWLALSGLLALAMGAGLVLGGRGPGRGGSPARRR